MKSRQVASSPFVGQSKMDALLREYPWTKTSVGPPEKWPDSWRAAARLCLDSAFPMLLLLGEEFLFVYNDPCIPLTGAKHPEIIAQPTSRAWSEIWADPIEPMVRSVIATCEPTCSEDLFLPLERFGYAEETHFILAFSAIRDADRMPNAVFVTLRETTESVLVARRVACLDALTARCFSAETATEACTIATEVMDQYLRDMPFTLLYLIDREGGSARLAAYSGLKSCPDSLASEIVALTELQTTSSWPIPAAVRRQQTIEASIARTLITPHLRDTLFTPKHALTIPLADPAGGTAGVFVAGLNPMRPMDECRKLAAAVAARLTTAIANANVKQRTRERAEALAALDRAKTLFLSDVSHEFRTPLTLLLSPLDEVIANAQLDAADLELLRTSRRAGTRLLKLVQSLLDFSRVEAGRVQAAFEPTDLAALTADLASLFRSTFERANVVLAVDCEPLAEPVYVDPDMWEKIVLNLLSNAFKFTLAGEVRVRLSSQEEWIVLEVRDTGCGVAPKDVPHVFDRFHRGQTTRARSAEGSGIGLSLVQELLRLHGGTVTLDSEVDRGTTVTVKLRRGSKHLAPEQIRASRTQSVRSTAVPFLEEVSGWVPDPDEAHATQPAIKVPSRQRRRTTAPLVGTERILIVDDNADMRRYIRRILREHWSVETVSDGMSALERARRAPPDLLIADLMMPGLDGLSLLAALRDQESTAELPVLVLSARSNEDASIDALHAGADDFLPKPFTARELVARVAVQLARVRLRQAERMARQSAEETSQLKDELVTLLSQSLRNPLNVMLRTVSVLKEQSPGSEETRRALELIRASTREQHRLLDEVHDISCITAGCFEVHMARIAAPATLVSEEVEILRPIAVARRVRLESYIDAACGQLQGDAQRIRQIVHNLVSHALSCTQTTGNVIIECKGRGAFVEIIVRDNGAGISAEALPHVFDAHWQMQHARGESSRASALSLGLAVTHRIVELHGGRIFVSSDGEGRGTVFTVRLPAVANASLEQSVPVLAYKES
jgi:signal transduction histidine kinase